MKNLRIKDIVSLVKGRLSKGTDPEKTLTGGASLENAKETDVAYFYTGSFTRQDVSALKEKLENTQAGLILSEAEVPGVNKAMLIVENPKEAFLKVLNFLYAPEKRVGIHASAHVHKDVFFEEKESVYIAENAVIEAGVRIGKSVQIHANTVIRSGTTIGEGCIIENNVSIEVTTLGKGCWIGPGVRLGSRGFGYASSSQGHTFVPHIGHVKIGNDVDIGANSCVDRGMLDNTEIGDGTKLDDLIIVGHGCKIGKHCFLAAQTGMAGSTVLEDFVFVAGQVGFGGHLRVASGARISGQTGVISDIKEAGVYMGFPAEKRRDFLKKQIILKQLIKKEEEK
ncbi:MAG: UDP-3-O-(3-hydroxymyristoyl)glucosamine N-acyltransferase [Alphaproteobacteria bacterium]|nr:UDP-3-O-(3-hydroxymyristoyl)glucosamine N-acyltransferase [Alphaproteobacteria bacterium]